MANGTPVITSNVSSLPEGGGEAVLQVNPSDTDEIARAIRAAILDRALYDRLRADGLERADCETMQQYQAIL